MTGKNGKEYDLKKDDIVIIVDESKKRHEWKLGRITSVSSMFLSSHGIYEAIRQ